MSRCEDVGVNRLVADRPQVLFDGDWPARVNVSLADIGTGMWQADDRRTIGFSMAMSWQAFRHMSHDGTLNQSHAESPCAGDPPPPAPASLPWAAARREHRLRRPAARREHRLRRPAARREHRLRRPAARREHRLRRRPCIPTAPGEGAGSRSERRDACGSHGGLGFAPFPRGGVLGRPPAMQARRLRRWTCRKT